MRLTTAEASGPIIGQWKFGRLARPSVRHNGQRMDAENGGRRTRPNGTRVE